MERIKQIFVKGSFSGEDMDFLMANKPLLTHDHLVRLGLAQETPKVVVVEPVKEAERPTGEAFIAQRIIAEQLNPPKKRGRPRKVL
jgi:hypothetical protein